MTLDKLKSSSITINDKVFPKMEKSESKLFKSYQSKDFNFFQVPC